MYLFEHIWGNQRLVAQLRRAVQQQKISHASLFLGEAGTGKQTIANTFAGFILCQARGVEPCGQCGSCLALAHGNHPDVIYVTTEKKTMGVEEVRTQILETVDIKPYQYEKKIYIVQGADRLTPQAQNALLKTLEEPPSHVLFFLLAERAESFLQTVLSRVVCFETERLSAQQIAQYLQANGLADQGAEAMASYANGSIGRAKALLEDEAFLNMKEVVQAICASLDQMSLAEALLQAKELEKYKADLRFLDLMYLWQRDLLVAKTVPMAEPFLIQKEKGSLLQQLAHTPSAEEIANRAEAILRAKSRLQQNAATRLTLEVMMMELKGENI